MKGQIRGRAAMWLRKGGWLYIFSLKGPLYRRETNNVDEIQSSIFLNSLLYSSSITCFSEPRLVNFYIHLYGMYSFNYIKLFSWKYKKKHSILTCKVILTRSLICETIENSEVETTSQNTDLYGNMSKWKMHRNCL